MSTHTIGEVLNRLKDEFDDITISKIRFLESEGLISPDRTDSGYRKFTVADVERLRHVLRAQRDRYLPLKVIKDELARIDAGLPVEEPAAGPDPDTLERLLGDDAATGADAEPPLLDTAGSDVSLSLTELADAAGVAVGDLRALIDHGLIDGEGSFDGEDLQVAKAAGRLMANGLEARHLRMYRQFAEREIGFYEQLITPLLRQRNPDSRKAASEQAEALSREGSRLHRLVLARRLRDVLRS